MPPFDSSKPSPLSDVNNTPLRTVLIIPFVLLIATTVGLVGYLSFRNGQRAVNTLASQLRSELSARIDQHLQRYIQTPYVINRLNADAMRQGELVIGATQGGNQFLQQMKMTPAVNAIYCGNTNGEFFGISRESTQTAFDPSFSESVFQAMVSNPTTGGVMQLYGVDSTGSPSYFLEKVRPYDPRVRPWYRTAIATDKPTWSEVYLDFTSYLPTVTASLPVYNQIGNRLIGVCGVDVVLSEELRMFLKSLEVGRSGETFIIERSGTLISSSTDEPLTRGEADQARRLKATESGNWLIRSTAEYLGDRFTDLTQIQTAQQLDFMLDGQRQYVQVLPFGDGQGLDWLIVVVIPEADFMGDIYTNTYRTIWLCLAALAVATGLGVLISRGISRPLLYLTQASEKMAKGDLNQQVKVEGFQELYSLADSFNSMASQLQASFAQLKEKNADLQRTNTTVERAKGTLAKTNEQLEAVINAVPGTISWISFDGRYLGVNQYLAEILGLAPEQIIGQEVGFFTNSPEFIAFIQAFLVSPALSASREVPIIIQGEIRYYLLVVQKYQNGRATVSVGIDITDRYKARQALFNAEEKYRSIYENALEGIFQSSPEGRFLSVNPAMAKIYGYGSPQEMVEAITDIATQVYVDPEARKKFQLNLSKDGQIKESEYQIYRQDGSMIWVEENTRAVLDHNGQLLYYEGIIQDITERKERENELKRQLEDLKIEIDHKKREKDVALITQNGFFKELQNEVNRINLDEFWS